MLIDVPRITLESEPAPCELGQLRGVRHFRISKGDLPRPSSLQVDPGLKTRNASQSREHHISPPRPQSATHKSQPPPHDPTMAKESIEEPCF